GGGFRWGLSRSWGLWRRWLGSCCRRRDRLIGRRGRLRSKLRVFARLEQRLDELRQRQGELRHPARNPLPRIVAIGRLPDEAGHTDAQGQQEADEATHPPP